VEQAPADKTVNRDVLPVSCQVHLLIADDDPDAVALFRGHLQRAGAARLGGVLTTLHDAPSGVEALELARTIRSLGERLACALVDLTLDGDRDGIDTVLALWDLDPDVQCTLVTTGQELQSELLHRIPGTYADRWDFLCHPVAAFEMIQRVSRSLSTWFARHRERARGRERKDLLRELRAANQELEQTVRERTRALADRNAELEVKNRDLEAALRGLGAAQSRLLQQEKMASIGQLAAGVAHELNNPIGFVHSNLGTLERYWERVERMLGAIDEGLEADDALATLRAELKLDFLRKDLPELIAESREGTERVRKIVTDLKVFSHPAQSEPEYADLNEGLETTLNIVRNEIKYRARVVKKLGDIPPLRCYPGQINQVFMNLLVNAAQAMDGFGEIRVATARDNDDVVVTVSDNGPGIPEELQARVFEPFFTTKEPGQGTGLGLSISCDIVRKHGGTMAVTSHPGQGTTFTVRLPTERTT
jgi:signal transduction histidine kinase